MCHDVVIKIERSCAIIYDLNATMITLKHEKFSARWIGS